MADRMTGSLRRLPRTKALGAVIVAAALVSAGVTGCAQSRVDAASLTDTAASPSATAPAAVPSPAPVLEPLEETPLDPETVPAPHSDPAVVIADSSVTPTSALGLLATLPIKGKAPKTGYDRTDKFGTAWLDVDRNGCDTRNDILQRDLTATVLSGTCKVLSGTLAEPYTRSTVNFVRGNDTSRLVQIDHVVALSNAWQTGAQKLTQDQRESFANDPLNLLAVDGSANGQKGDGDAATWLPPNKSFRCQYVARQVSVKATYGLWVAQAEHDAIERVLASCPDEPAVTSAFAPKPSAVVKPEATKKPEATRKPEPKPEPEPDSVYYKNCAAARAAGAAPVYRGDPGYAKHLDRDGHGIGCE